MVWGLGFRVGLFRGMVVLSIAEVRTVEQVTPETLRVPKRQCS